MAKVYTIFFGVLFIVLCIYKGIGNDTVAHEELPFKEKPTAVLMAREVADNKQQVKKEVAAPADNAGLRKVIVALAVAELGVKEATGRNDGQRVEEYLRYTGLGKGYEWCAAFVSWVYGQAGFAAPRNPWSPALFPKAKTYGGQGAARGRQGKAWATKTMLGDVFGIYGAKAKRINHVGLVKAVESEYLLTVEGNSNDRVESRRRHRRTIYALADWLTE